MKRARLSAVSAERDEWLACIRRGQRCCERSYWRWRFSPLERAHREAWRPGVGMDRQRGDLGLGFDPRPASSRRGLEPRGECAQDGA